MVISEGAESLARTSSFVRRDGRAASPWCATRASGVRADRSPADRAAVPPASAPLRRKRAVAHDVEAQFSTVVTPALGAGHPVDRVHRSSVPGGNPRFSPKISEVKATDQQRPAQAPQRGRWRGKLQRGGPARPDAVHRPHAERVERAVDQVAHRVAGGRPARGGPSAGTVRFVFVVRDRRPAVRRGRRPAQIHLLVAGRGAQARRRAGHRGRGDARRAPYHPMTQGSTSSSSRSTVARGNLAGGGRRRRTADHVPGVGSREDWRPRVSTMNSWSDSVGTVGHGLLKSRIRCLASYTTWRYGLRLTEWELPLEQVSSFQFSLVAQRRPSRPATERPFVSGHVRRGVAAAGSVPCSVV